MHSNISAADFLFIINLKANSHWGFFKVRSERLHSRFDGYWYISWYYTDGAIFQAISDVRENHSITNGVVPIQASEVSIQ